MDRGELHVGGVSRCYTTILRVVNSLNTAGSQKFRAKSAGARKLIVFDREAGFGHSSEPARAELGLSRGRKPARKVPVMEEPRSGGTQPDSTVCRRLKAGSGDQNKRLPGADAPGLTTLPPLRGWNLARARPRPKLSGPKLRGPPLGGSNFAGTARLPSALWSTAARNGTRLLSVAQPPKSRHFAATNHDCYRYNGDNYVK